MGVPYGTPFNLGFEVPDTPNLIDLRKAPPEECPLITLKRLARLQPWDIRQTFRMSPNNHPGKNQDLSPVFVWNRPNLGVRYLRVVLAYEEWEDGWWLHAAIAAYDPEGVFVLLPWQELDPIVCKLGFTPDTIEVIVRPSRSLGPVVWHFVMKIQGPQEEAA